MIYAINAFETVDSRLGKTFKARAHFPVDEGATNLNWLALRNISAGALQITERPR